MAGSEVGREGRERAVCPFVGWLQSVQRVAVDPKAGVAMTREYARDGIPRAVADAIHEQIVARTGKPKVDVFSSYPDGREICYRATGCVGVFPYRCSVCSKAHLLVVGPKMAQGVKGNDLGSLANVCDMAAYARRGLRKDGGWLHEVDPSESWSGAFNGDRPLWMFQALRYVVWLEDLLQRDFRRYYVTHEGTLQGRVKGRLNVARYLNRWSSATQHQLPCRWNEFTFDNWDNRLLEAALNACQRYGKPGSAFARLIAERLNSGKFRLAFDEVFDILPWEADFSRARLRAVSAHYRQCLPLAEQLLKRAGAARPDPPLITLSWIDTHKLFEEFVFSIVSEAAREEGVQATQHGEAPLFTRADRPVTETDVEVSDKSGCRLVVDAKYKQLLEGEEEPSQPEEVMKIITGDMYQMYFYLRSRKCREGLIVFPYWNAEGRALTELTEDGYFYNAPEAPSMERRVRFLGLNLAGGGAGDVFNAAKNDVRRLLKAIRAPDAL